MFDDQEIRQVLKPEVAVAVMRQALLNAENGILRSPPRVAADLESGKIVYTSGALQDEWFGYRSYDTFGRAKGENVVVLHDWDTGQVTAFAVGTELGARRTGAIGAVAVDLLARSDASCLAMIGTGAQAWAQLWAIRTVRKLTRVSVWSRDPAHRAAFAQRAQSEFGVNAVSAESAESAVRESDIVVTATSSPVPVILANWVNPGCHVTTLGPKAHGRAEFNGELAVKATSIATDSLNQVHAYEPPFVLDGTPHIHRMVSLGSLVASASTRHRNPDEITLFCSVGLAGTEVALLEKLVRIRNASEPPLR